MTDETKGCPACGSLAATMHGTIVTAMMVHTFRDDQGKVHYHDPNTRTTQLTCSNCGLVYSESSRPRCWCGQEGW